MSSGFISEVEIAEKRKVRQEEWEKVRKPDQPIGKYTVFVLSVKLRNTLTRFIFQPHLCLRLMSVYFPFFSYRQTSFIRIYQYKFEIGVCFLRERKRYKKILNNYKFIDKA